jgi:hypothetical protein
MNDKILKPRERDEPLESRSGELETLSGNISNIHTAPCPLGLAAAKQSIPSSSEDSK